MKTTETTQKKLWRALALSASMCAVFFTSALGMNENNQNNPPQQPTQPPLPQNNNTGNSPIEKLQPNPWDVITNHLGTKEAGRLKQTSKPMKKKAK